MRRGFDGIWHCHISPMTAKKKRNQREREANAPLALASSFVCTDAAKWRLGSTLPSQIPDSSSPPEPDHNSSQAEPRSHLLVDL